MESKIVSILEDAGWYAGRQIDISYMMKDYSDNDMPAPNAVIETLLKEYWNIRLEFITPDGKHGDIRLNTEVASDVPGKILYEFGQLLNETILPVGSINDDTASLLISHTGKFYMATSGDFFKIGADFFEALDTIIYQKKVLRIN